jgi:hypothetical protein
MTPEQMGHDTARSMEVSCLPASILTLTSCMQSPNYRSSTAILTNFTTLPKKHLLRYLKGTIDMSITFGDRRNRGSSLDDAHLKIIGYTDASWADNVDDRKSTTGMAFMLNGGMISCESKKQATVALSTMEAEYMALCQGTKEVIWLQRLFVDIQGTAITMTTIDVDNQATISHAKDPTDHARMKHIDIKYHFSREVS